MLAQAGDHPLDTLLAQAATPDTPALQRETERMIKAGFRTREQARQQAEADILRQAWAGVKSGQTPDQLPITLRDHPAVIGQWDALWAHALGEEGGAPVTAAKEQVSSGPDGRQTEAPQAPRTEFADSGHVMTDASPADDLQNEAAFIPDPFFDPDKHVPAFELLQYRRGYGLDRNKDYRARARLDALGFKVVPEDDPRPLSGPWITLAEYGKMREEAKDESVWGIAQAARFGAERALEHFPLNCSRIRQQQNSSGSLWW